MELKRQTKKIARKLIISTFCFFPAFSYGKNDYFLKIPNPLTYSIKVEAGSPIELVMDDGRVAQLQIRKLPEQVLDLPLGIDESTCSDVKPSNLCTMKFGISSFRLALKWIKNEEDASRLGEEVTDSEDEEPLVELFGSFNTETKKLFPEESKNISPYKMLCEDFRWLGQKSKSAPEKLDVVDWSTEFMLQNPESNLNENRAFQGAMGVKFAKSASDSIKLSDFNYITNLNNSAPLLVFGDVIGWVIRKPKTEELCQVSMKADPQAIQNVSSQISKLEAETPFLPFTYDPKSVIWQQFVEENKYRVSGEEHIEEPYRTMMLLGLIGSSASISTDENGDTKYEIEIYPKVLR